MGKAVAAARERWVVATKYTLAMREGDPNGVGNSRKNMTANGTDAMVDSMQEFGGLPTRNFREVQFEGADKLGPGQKEKSRYGAQRDRQIESHPDDVAG